MGNQPVYRTRSHAYSCRCGRCPQSRPGDWGVIGPLLLFGGIAVVAGFWPAMVWHGYTDTGGWRWDVHSTIGVVVWWCVVIFLAMLIAAGNRAPAPRRPGRAGNRPVRTPPPAPAAFRLPCCGTEPGDGMKPARHMYNCPHLEGDLR